MEVRRYVKSLKARRYGRKHISDVKKVALIRCQLNISLMNLDLAKKNHNHIICVTGKVSFRASSMNLRRKEES